MLGVAGAAGVAFITLQETARVASLAQQEKCSSSAPFKDGGEAYARGDYETAMCIIRPLADRGQVDAQFNVGHFYFEGLGVKQNYFEAEKWFRLAADKGYPDAQYNLGYLYANGDGVPQDYVQAHKWFDLAAGNPTSGKETRDRAVNTRNLVASKMTPAQIADAQKLASEWKPISH
jgi:TPR repeat protein